MMSSPIEDFARQCGIKTEEAEKLLEMKITDPLRFWDAYPRLIGKGHVKQNRVFESRANIKLVLGGNRSGKTFAGAKLTAMYALDQYYWYDDRGDRHKRNIGKVPEIWVVSLSGDTQDSAAQPALMQFIPDDEITDLVKSKGTRIKSFVIKSTGTKVVFKTCDQRRRRLQGAGLRFVWMDEEPPEEVYEEISMRVAGGIPLDIAITMTPTEGISWTYHQLYKSEDQEYLGVFKMGTRDNPWLTEGDIEKLKWRLTMRGLSDQEIAMRLEGDYVQMQDLVCEWFSPHSNYMEESKMPLDECTHYLCADFGFSDPSVVLFAGMDSEGNVYIYDGINVTGMEHETLALETKRKMGDYRYAMGWGDSSSPEAIKTFKKHGIRMKPVKKQRVKGTSGQNTQSWHATLSQVLRKYGRTHDDGRPRLYFAKHLRHYDDNVGRKVHWIGQQLSQLKWGVKGAKGEEEATGKWDDTRKHGHHFDAVYALAYLLYMINYKEKARSQNRHSLPKWKNFRIYNDGVI